MGKSFLFYILRFGIPMFVLFQVYSETTFGVPKSNCFEAANKRSLGSPLPCLVTRFDSFTGENQIGEGLYQLTWLKGNERAKLAIRICSDQPLFASIAFSAADPFDVVKRIHLLLPGDSPDIVLLRSKDCEQSEAKSPPFVTEVWSLSQDVAGPSFLEKYGYQDLNIKYLNAQFPKCATSGSEKAANVLADKMRGDKHIFGLIIGNYNGQPTQSLKINVERARKILEKKQIKMSRYYVGYRPSTNDVTSPCVRHEQRRPRIAYLMVP